MKARILGVATMTLALIAAAPGGIASVDTYPKNFDIDVLHYRFELTLSDAMNRISGTTTVQVRFLTDEVGGFELDLIGPEMHDAPTGMTVLSVEELVDWPSGPSPAGETQNRAVSAGASVQATQLEFKHAVHRLLISLSTPSRRTEVRRFRIRYAGTPATGLVIGPNKHGDRTFFSDNWPDKARNWLPTIDHPYEKATSEMVITAPHHYKVISNGLLVEESTLVDEALARARDTTGMTAGTFRRTHWRQSVPIAPWLFVLGAAPFAVDYYDEFEGKSLQTWVYRQDRDAGFYDFAVPTKDVLQFYTDTIGPYSYEKLANIQSNSVGGGMEAASAIFYGDDSVTGERTVRWRNVIIHEIAHQWWGNAVTEDDWDHVWLSEGFATYFTLLYREYAYGRDDFLDGLADARRLIVDFYAENPDYRIVHDNLDDMGRVVNRMTYQKGAWFLHMLRGVLGEDRFWAGIREYYRLYRDGNASTDDFREVMENTYEPAADLTGLFQQWLYQGGLPHLRGGWSWDAAAGELVIDLEQVEDDGYRFDMEIPVRIVVPPAPAAGSGGGGRGGRGSRPQTIDRRIVMPATSSQTRIALERAPSEVVLDPDHWLLMEADFERR